MSVTLGEVLASTWRRMGTSSADPEYPRAQMVIYANTMLAELHADCAAMAHGDALVILGRSITATADHTYALASQSPAITAVLQIREIRARSATGDVLRPVAADQLPEYASGVAVTGPLSATVLRTGTSTEARATLYLDYIEGPPTLVEDSDVLPSWLPDQFRDVLELMIAREALPQGGESALSGPQLERLQTRLAMLWSTWSNRTPYASIRRVV